MIEKMRIQGGARLKGEVAVSGGKNAAVAIIPAALLAHSPCTIENLPDIDDVHVLIDMLRWVGRGGGIPGWGRCRSTPPRWTSISLPYELSSRMRASYYLAPVLLGAVWLRRSAHARRLRHRRPAHRPDHQGHDRAGRGRAVERGVLYVSTMGLSGSEVYFGYAQRGRYGEYHAHRSKRPGQYHHL